MAMNDEFLNIPSCPAPLIASGPVTSETRIIVHLAQGGAYHGKLLGISRIDHSVVALGSDGIVTRFPFGNLRMLEFSRRFTSPQGHSFQDMGAENFFILYQDDKTMRGKAVHHVSDDCGLHLFVHAGKAIVEQLFVPHEQIKSSTFHTASIQSNAAVVASDSKMNLEMSAMNRIARNREQLFRILESQSSYYDHEYHRCDAHRIGEILLEEHVITQEILDHALQQQKVQGNKRLGEILEAMGAVSGEQINQKLAQKFGMPYVSLMDFDIDHQVLNAIPAEMARQHNLLPIALYRDHIVIALDNPLDKEAIDSVHFIVGKPVEVALSSRENLLAAIDKYYGSEEGLEEELGVAEEESARFHENEVVDFREAERLAKEKPIVRLVNGFIVDAIRKRASDIHVHPEDDEVQLIYRIDGTLIKIRTFSRTLLPAVVSRIKILGRMDIAEHRLPQDGRMRISDHDNLVDLRLSIIPTVHGESVVIRLLNTKFGLRNVSELGLNQTDQEVFTDLLYKSYGMFLVTGPTGSGKSTTLYAALQEVKKQNVHVITVEDPVEYQVKGVEQIHVRASLGYTFAESLRHILRHDPDVIMIGEIRDVETGKIAVESALTGHLVLSTLHTNSAAGTVTRLLEMGIEPYLVSSTLLGVLAQRLVRKNCPLCLEVEDINRAMRKALNVPEDEVFYRGKGCKQCNHTGYSGRLAVYELLRLSSQVRTLIEQRASTDAIHQQAIKDGMVTLTANALDRARNRITSLEEVYRVRLD